jgi:uncharacterized protein (TIGR02145 family)
MGNTLAPLNGNDYPIVYANDAKGGHHQLATIAERDAIPVMRRQLGMLCSVMDNGSGNPKTYQLIGGLSNANWIPFLTTGGTGYQILSYNPTSHILSLENGGNVDLTGLVVEDKQLISYNPVTHILTIERGGSVDISDLVLNEIDPKWTSESANYYTKTEMQTEGAAQIHFGNITDKPNTLGGFEIADAMNIYYPANQITSDNITQWDEAYNRGDHSIVGYLNTNLASGSIYVGNDQNIATETTISGDFSLSNTGILSHNMGSITESKIKDYAITNNKLSIEGQHKGDLLYYDGTTWIGIPIGGEGQVLGRVNGIPAWINLTVTAPSVSTRPITNITGSTATGGGIVTGDGGAILTTRGLCWSTNPYPTLSDNFTTEGSDIGEFTSTITNLTDGVVYYFAAYATNRIGTTYGKMNAFRPPGDYEYSIIPTDYDGNQYNTVEIGNQIWMAENLKTTKFNDNTPIPLVTDDTEWDNLTTPAYCWYNNDESTYKNDYGALYNHFTVQTGNLCPTGWHIPTNDDWNELKSFLGDNSGGQLKEEGLNHWFDPNLGANNNTGFTGLPGGARGWGGFWDLGYYAYYWSQTDITYYYLGCDLDYIEGWTDIFGGSTVIQGSSVRCIKD